MPTRTHVYDVLVTVVEDTRDRLQIKLYKPAATPEIHVHDEPIASVLIPKPMRAGGNIKLGWYSTADPESLSVNADIQFAINRLFTLIDEVNR
jgi:hypothetical protein